jgi:hypothetical protein
VSRRIWWFEVLGLCAFGLSIGKQKPKAEDLRPKADSKMGRPLLLPRHDVR